ncbi:MAG: hypothetical protein IT428_06135 [Planctomycetaceae bacterium]|nr:hypothetical protein [Planctomycetaceae bacterium]
MPSDYAKDMLDRGQLSKEDYDRLIAARSRDLAAINARLSEAARNGDARKRLAVKGQGDGGKAWQHDLDAWTGNGVKK